MRQPHRLPENNPEHNWCSQKVTRSAKDYSGQQQRLFHQPSKYSGHQQYRQNRTASTSSSFNTYGSEKTKHCGNIHSKIPTPYIQNCSNNTKFSHTGTIIEK